MYCPMKFSNPKTTFMNINKDMTIETYAQVDCEEEKCAWWIDWIKRCAINQIAQGFYVDKEMHENPTGEKKNGK